MGLCHTHTCVTSLLPIRVPTNYRCIKEMTSGTVQKRSCISWCKMKELLYVSTLQESFTLGHHIAS